MVNNVPVDDAVVVEVSQTASDLSSVETSTVLGDDTEARDVPQRNDRWRGRSTAHRR